MKKYILLFVVAIIGAVTACDKMNDTHSQYRDEVIYSGKVLDLKAYGGIERIFLKWTNPKDFKSKSTYVEYYVVDNDVKVLEFPDLIDTLVIPELEGAPYTVKVYTKDAEGNKSIPTQVAITTLTREEATNLAGPVANVEITDASKHSVTFKLTTLRSNLFVDWIGSIVYSIYDANTVYSEGALYGLPIMNGTKKVDSWECPLVLPGSGIYNFKYSVTVTPKVGTEAFNDTVVISGNPPLNIIIPPAITTSPKSIGTQLGSGGKVDVTVFTNQPEWGNTSWDVTSDVAWCIVTPDFEANKFTIEVEANPSTSATRKATVTINSGAAEPLKLTVEQSKGIPTVQ
jgi:hypothetical protein